MDSPAYLRTIHSDLSTADIQIRPASSQTVAVPGGQPVFRVEFTAPSPLGSVSS
jgi:hypothetical protein